ncbi:sigma-70 family RNA polymerase sigma factor [Ketobacter sp.]|uniref:sigma-70 family RNA polymerase sigma factor n=1 Tax=Ketobacter sp. TaxID=2083498 RepID=UPI0025B8BBA5|nr:sigma-70 family RNA polymerase sigma factor [Ketobacter sp.]
MSGTPSAESVVLHTWYNNHHYWLLNVIRRRVGCVTTAEDLAHDVFVRLMGKTLPAPLLEPRAYLARVAHGLVVDRQRRQRVEQAWLASLSVLSEQEAPSPESQVIIIDTLTRIDALLHQLAPRPRQVFLMSRLEGIAYQDIAQTLDVSLSTVQKDMAQALRHCYQVLMG